MRIHQLNTKSNTGGNHSKYQAVSIGGDTTLAALAHEVQAHETDMNAPGREDELCDGIMDAQIRLIRHMADLPANSPRGIISKIRAYRVWTGDDFMTSGDPEHELLASLIRDMERFFATA